MSQQKSKKTKIVGKVLSASQNKTIAVRATRVKRHPKYRKQYTIYTRYLAHDEKNEAEVGDVVEIEESAPQSKRKRWTLVKKVK